MTQSPDPSRSRAADEIVVGAFVLGALIAGSLPTLIVIAFIS